MSFSQEEKDKEEIEICYLKMYRCMLEKDIEALKDILDFSFVLVHMTGMHQSREEFISYIIQGRLRYFSARMEHMDTQVSGDKARLVGQSCVESSVFGCGQSTWRLQLAIDLVRKNDRWTMTLAKASTY